MMYCIWWSKYNYRLGSFVFTLLDVGGEHASHMIKRVKDECNFGRPSGTHSTLPKSSQKVKHSS